MEKLLEMFKEKTAPAVQVFVGVLTTLGFTVPENAHQIIVNNLDTVLGALIVLTAFIPGLFQGKGKNLTKDIR